MKKVLVLASNLGLWGEELQAPWDALNKAGFKLTLATQRGITPLPLQLSVDKSFVDPVQQYNVNPAEVVDRILEILKTGEWDNPIKIADAKADDYDAMVMLAAQALHWISLEMLGFTAFLRLFMLRERFWELYAMQ